MKQLSLTSPFKRKEVKTMKNFFNWFDKLKPKEKANFLVNIINLIIALINLITKIIG